MNDKTIVIDNPTIEIGGEIIKIEGCELDSTFLPHLNDRAIINIELAFDLFDVAHVSEDIILCIERYIKEKKRPNAFLYSMLSNNLYQAYCSANGKQLFAIPAILHYLATKVSEEYWGSPEKVEKWLHEGPEDGK